MCKKNSPEFWKGETFLRERNNRPLSSTEHFLSLPPPSPLSPLVILSPSFSLVFLSDDGHCLFSLHPSSPLVTLSLSFYPYLPLYFAFPSVRLSVSYLSKIFKMFLCSTLSFSFSWDRHFDGVTFTWSGTDALEPFSSLPLFICPLGVAPRPPPAFPPTLYSFLVADGLSHVVDTSQTIVVCVFL